MNVALAYVSGLRNILLDELKEKGLVLKISRTLRGRRQDFIIGDLEGDTERLPEVRSCANAFMLVAQFQDLPGQTRAALEVIEVALRKADYAGPLGHLAAMRHETYKTPLSYMFSLGIVDNPLETALVSRVARDALPANFGVLRQDAGYEVHLRLICIGNNGFLGFQIPAETMKSRDYKAVTLPGSLDPVIAYSMIRMSAPSPDDVFLDPLCGAGTCGIERCHYGDARRIIASDSSSEAVAATAANCESAGAAPEIRQWDAMALPLEDASVTTVVTDMPYGKDIPLGNAGLFIDGLFAEMARVMVPGGRFILLTASSAEVEGNIRRNAAFHKVKEYSLALYGFDLKIYSLARTGKAYNTRR